MYAEEIYVLFKNKSASNMEINRFVQLTQLYQYLNINNLHGDETKKFCFIATGEICSLDSELMNYAQVMTAGPNNILGPG